MEITLRPHPGSPAPFGGLLLTGHDAMGWLRAIQDAGLSLASTTSYALPGPDSNRAVGCLVTYPVGTALAEIGPHQRCQLVGGLLFVPERAVLYPQLSVAELDRLLVSRLHLLHPDTGLIELLRPIDWAEVLTTPALAPVTVQKPVSTPALPMQIRSFQVQPTPPDEVLERLDTDAFPQHEPLPQKPLNPLEKITLWGLNQLLGKPGSTSKPSPGWAGLQQVWARLTGQSAGDLIEKMRMNQADLAERNEREVDKLMKLLKNNPAEALKYAIPLDMDGTTRGTNDGAFDLTMLWGALSLFGNGRQGGGGGRGVALGGDAFDKLRQQYRQTAEMLIEQGDFMKAAFVYLKLLKDYSAAANTLEKGKLYAEAAAVWLKYVKDKAKAAHAYEQANMTQTAIDLYVDISNHEKAGDLLTTFNRMDEARIQYQKVVDKYVTQHQYVKAATFCRQKLYDAETAQSLLLTGWRTSRDAENCLNKYLANLPDLRQTGPTLHELYRTEVTDTNLETFLNVIRHEYNRHADLSEPIADMAHEIIAALLPTNPAIASKLRFFNRPDSQLLKDITRFKTNRR